MKLFEFLKILNKEKFPFQLEYQDWSGNILVKVETFSNIEIYSFNEDGIFDHTEYIESNTTEDENVIIAKITDLINRPERAWIDASKDLGIEFIHPYIFKGLNDVEYEVTGLLPEFGFDKGVIISTRKSDEEAVLMADLANEYLMTALNPNSYDKYDRALFIETLNEWGWIGKGKKPIWIK